MEKEKAKWLGRGQMVGSKKAIKQRFQIEIHLSHRNFLDALASLRFVLESEWVMLLRLCQILGISSVYVQGIFRVGSE